MADAMVTIRMPERKKQEGLRALKRSGLNASQTINNRYRLSQPTGTAS